MLGGREASLVFGTPASGAGIHGCLESGCSVVCLCYDEHHRTHLQKFLLQRAVEAMVSGSTAVFKDEALQAKSAELKLTNATRAASANKAAHQENDPEAEAAPKNTRRTQPGTRSRNANARPRNQQRLRGFG